MDRQGLVPAAGRGTRLRPLTDDRPKALVEVGERPLVEHVLETLAPHVDGYVVVIGYRGEALRDAVGGTYAGKPVAYVEQPDARGLADAVHRAESLVGGPFLQLNGDNVLRGNVGEVASTRREAGADATLLVEEVSPERARRGGVLEFEAGGVVDLVEKPVVATREGGSSGFSTRSTTSPASNSSTPPLRARSGRTSSTKSVASASVSSCLVTTSPTLPRRTLSPFNCRNGPSTSDSAR